MSDEFNDFLTRTWASSQGKADAQSGSSSTLSRTVLSAFGGKDALKAYDNAHTSTSNLLVHKTLQDQAKQARNERWEQQRRIREERQRQMDQERREREYQQQLEDQERKRVQSLKKRITFFSTRFREMEVLAKELASSIDREEPAELDFLQASTVLIYILTLTEAEKDFEFELNVPFLSISEKAAFEDNCKRIYGLYLDQFKDDPRQAFITVSAFVFTYGQLVYDKAVWLLQHLFESETESNIELVEVKNYSKLDSLNAVIESSPLTVECTFPTTSVENTKARISRLADEFSDEIADRLGEIRKALEKSNSISTHKILEILEFINDPSRNKDSNSNQQHLDLLIKLIEQDQPGLSLGDLAATLQFTPKYPEYILQVAERLIEERLWIYKKFIENSEDLERFQQIVKDRYKEDKVELMPFAGKSIRFKDINGEVTEIGGSISSITENMLIKDGTILPIEMLEKLHSDPKSVIGNKITNTIFIESTTRNPYAIDFTEFPYLNKYANMLLNQKLSDTFAESVEHVEKLYENKSSSFKGSTITLIIIAIALLYFSFNLVAGASFLLASVLIAKSQGLIEEKKKILDVIHSEKQHRLPS